MNLEQLKAQHPWPDVKPDMAFDDHGWFLPGNQKMLQKYIKPSFNLIFEVGSWLGKSTRFMMDLAPNATVVCVDTWSAEDELINLTEAERTKTAYAQFLANHWEQRHRIVPVRGNALEQLEYLKQYNLKPDLIYFDAEKDTGPLYKQLVDAVKTYPDTIICGDDYAFNNPLTNTPTVRMAVDAAARTMQLRIIPFQNAWVYTSD